MKLSTFLLLFVFVQYLSAQQQDIINYPLPKEHKALGTSSMKINDSTSIHFAITKNKVTKKIILKPFLITNKKAKALNSLFLDKGQEIISAHLSEGVLTIIYEETIVKKFEDEDEKEEKKVYAVDIHIKENKVSEIKNLRIREYQQIIITSHATYFFGETDFSFFIFKINNTNNSEWKNYTITKRVPIASKTFYGRKIITYIKTNQFVSAFPYITSRQLFKHGNTFYITYNKNKSSETYIYTLPFGSEDSYDVSWKKISSSLIKNRVHRSFLTRDYLFQFSVGRRQAILDIQQYKTGKHITSFYYSSEKLDPYHKYYFKGKETDAKATEQRFFISFASATPFITVNMAKDNGYVIEIGNFTTFPNHYPLFDNMMIREPLPPIKLSKSGGPNHHDYNEIFFYNEPPLKTSLKFSLDNSFNVTEKLSETLYDSADYSEIIEKINKIHTFKDATYTNFEGVLRIMVFDKYRKSFFVRNKKITQD